ncbi:MAG: hypothetical protein ABIV94_01945 [Acidimicrobiales bacterium]
MAPTQTTNRGARAVLLLAVIVLVAGAVAALTHDDGKKKTSTLPTPTTVPQVVSTTTSVKATTTTSTSPTSTTEKAVDTTTTTSEPAPTTTAQPAVPTPEQATNGLFAAYRSSDRDQAARFASPDVIDVLFAAPYSPPDGSFQGCVADGDVYRCQYSQGASNYDMVAARNASEGSYAIVIITATRPMPTSTAAPSP